MFISKKEQVYAAINNSAYLDKGSKKDMINYLDEFYKVLADDRKLKTEFIDNARQL